jgi:hypothetical protein
MFAKKSLQMKKLFISYLTFGFLSIQAFGQFTGGEVSPNQPSAKPQDTYNFANQGGMALPSFMAGMGNYMGSQSLFSVTTYGYDYFNNYVYATDIYKRKANLGLVWNIAYTDYFINSLKFAENMRLAISANWMTLKFNTITSQWDFGGGNFSDDITSIRLGYNMGVGPSFRIYPIKTAPSFGLQFGYQLSPELDITVTPEVGDPELEFNMFHDLSFKIMYKKVFLNFQFTFGTMGVIDAAEMGTLYNYYDFNSIDRHEISLLEPTGNIENYSVNSSIVTKEDLAYKKFAASSFSLILGFYF